MTLSKSKKHHAAVLAVMGLTILLVWILIFVYQNWNSEYSGMYEGYKYKVEYRDISLDTINTITVTGNYVEISGTRITLKDWIRKWNPDMQVVRLRRREEYPSLTDVKDKWKINAGSKINPSKSIMVFQDTQRGREIHIPLPDKLIGERQIFQVNETTTIFYFAGGVWKGGPDPGCCTALITIIRPPNQAFNPDPAATI